MELWLQNANVGVTGGNAIYVEQAPYMALLYTQPDAPCGGVIVDEKYILTSSVCCNQRTEDLYCFVGTNRKEQLGRAVIIDQIIKYPKDLKPSICLIRLREPLRFSNTVAKIQMNDGSIILSRDTVATLTAFGAENSNDVSSLKELRQGEIPISDVDWCKKEDKRLDDLQLCAGDQEHNGCYGDVGGALTVDNILVGVLAVIPNDCKYQPSRFARISSYKQWIDQVIRQYP
ncbi:trypsin-1-like isoform X2 [Leguminivora glycinivorella]|uniref:trypsin-1-like isoform X2 n=1 Tax=Leguminivora glycinivorella TaxID=1035111 RepID=UPI00200DBB0B|nr:trypsin-1-like isoform X2 [Leguminivora glycinivorella]